MKVLVYSIHGFDKESLELSAQNKHTLHFTEEQLNEKTAQMAKGYDAVALFSSDVASKEVLNELHSLNVKYITLRSVGYDHVDITTAKSLNIKVANVPEYSPYAIAEHAVAMLMALNRKIVQSQLLMQLQDFRLDNLVGFDLHEKTVGIIGTGKIGFAFAKIMNGFGCHLLGYDPTQHVDAHTINLNYTSLNELLKRSDVVALNCPLNEHTKRLIGAPQFEMMKPGCILINTARGAVIDTKALIKYLETGHIGGACLDVYENERGLFFYDHRKTILTDELFARLRSFNNVLITGHQAFLTHEALTGIAQTTINNLSAWEKTGVCDNEIG